MFLCAYGDFEGCERGIVLSMVWGRWRNLKQFIAETVDRGGVINKRGGTLERMFWDENHHIQRTMADSNAHHLTWQRDNFQIFVGMEVT